MMYHNVRIKFIALIIFGGLFFQFISCRFKHVQKDKISDEKINADSKFKEWLRDTLVKIRSEKDLMYNQSIHVEDDSLSIEINNSYNLIIDKKYKGDNKELVYALDLLGRNNLLPENEFNLELTISTFYTKPVVKQLIYSFDSEVLKFNVHYGDSLIKYRFLKGNLIERIVQVDTTIRKR